MYIEACWRIIINNCCLSLQIQRKCGSSGYYKKKNWDTGYGGFDPTITRAQCACNMHAKHKARVKSWLFLVPLISQPRGNKLTLFFKHIFVNYCIVPHASQTLLLHASHGTKCIVSLGLELELDPILESQVYFLPKYNSQVNKRNLSQMDAFRSKY